MDEAGLLARLAERDRGQLFAGLDEAGDRLQQPGRLAIHIGADAELLDQHHAVAGNAIGEQFRIGAYANRSEEHTSELQSLMRISYAVFCSKKQQSTAAQR